MKNMTIWQRLNTSLLLLILLGLSAVIVEVWIDKSRSQVSRQSDKLDMKRNEIQKEVFVIGGAIRGQLLDPKNDPDRKRRDEAERTLPTNLQDLQKEFADKPELTAAFRKLREFVLSTLLPFEHEIADRARQDPVAATAYYNGNYGALSRQREQLFTELDQQVEMAKHLEALKVERIALGGMVCLGFIVLISLVVGLMQSSAVTEPLSRVVATIERMRRGDFTERLHLKRRDEFGVLGDGLNRLADDLSELVGQVQRSGIQVNTTATQISATSKEQQSTAHEIAATTAQIGATSKEISATSKELVKTMNEVTHVAEETAGLAGSGQNSISRMEATMRHIMDAAGSITSKLAVLSEKTTNINSVVTTITKVADQTNLLSLNAAIEAEKAGEYGLGFAVVAMEIRRLADQTAVATYDIEKMVKEMQSAVAAGVMGMDKFSEEVRRGVDEVRQVSTHLAQIIHQVQTLTPRFQTVNEGMHAQATGAQQISETLTQLSEAAQQTAESLRQSNVSIDQLNGAARILQASVARFKLNNGA